MLAKETRDHLSVSSSSSGSDADVAMPDPPPTSQGRKRGAVSAEVPSEEDAKFTPPVFRKTSEQEGELTKILKENFLFRVLDGEDFQTTLQAFEAVVVQKDHVLIKQGDAGDCLYVVEEGSFNVYKTVPPKADAELVNVMHKGDTIGELALLYSTPRQATVIARETSRMWRLDRQTFSTMVRGASMKRRKENEDSLKKVPLLKGLGDYERQQLADCIERKEVAANTLLIEEGVDGHEFYVLIAGKAEAIKNGAVVKRYKEGDYFGELALLDNRPRAASVRIVDGDAVVAVLKKDSFDRLLGPLSDIMRQNAELYSDAPIAAAAAAL